MANDLIYKGHAIGHQGDMLNLTDMWRAAGSPEGKRPAEWARYAGRQFIEFIAENLNVGSAHIEEKLFRVVRGGKNSGTSAHWQVGFAYAKHLSHEFHAWCNEVVRKHMEAAFADKERRKLSITVRKGWSDTVAAHGVEDRMDFARITNRMYLTLFRRKATEMRIAKGLKKGQALRDNLDPLGLSAIIMAEAMSSKSIADGRKWGPGECGNETVRCAELVKTAVMAGLRGSTPNPAVR